MALSLVDALIVLQTANLQLMALNIPPISILLHTHYTVVMVVAGIPGVVLLRQPLGPKSVKLLPQLLIQSIQMMGQMAIQVIWI